MPTMTERLAQLHGTRAAGTIEINEVALNEMIGFAARGGTIPTIQLLDGNLLAVRYGVIYARAQLPPALETGPAPKLTVTLASRVVAWGWRRCCGRRSLSSWAGASLFIWPLCRHSPRVVRSGRTSPQRASRLYRARYVSVSALPSIKELPMDEWLRSQLAAGLPALRGSVITGTASLHQELLNELVGTWLASTTQRPGAPALGVDLAQLRPFLKQASVRAETGTVLVDFQISI
jgi:hypothetical protein